MLLEIKACKEKKYSHVIGEETEDVYIVNTLKDDTIEFFMKCVVNPLLDRLTEEELGYYFEEMNVFGGIAHDTLDESCFTPCGKIELFFEGDEWNTFFIIKNVEMAMRNV